MSLTLACALLAPASIAAVAAISVALDQSRAPWAFGAATGIAAGALATLRLERTERSHAPETALLAVIIVANPVVWLSVLGLLASW